MKYFLGAIFAAAIAGAGLYSSGKNTLPPKPDPNLDYYNSSFDQQSEWMQKFAQRFVAASKISEANGTSLGIQATYSIDPSIRTLTMHMGKPKGTVMIDTELKPTERQKLTNHFSNLMLKNCHATIKKIDLVADTSVMFTAETNYTDMPTVSVLLNKKTCEEHLK